MNNQPQTQTAITCKHCHAPIYATANGGWCHVGNTTSSPMTCYVADGSQRIAVPSNVNESLVTL